MNPGAAVLAGLAAGARIAARVMIAVVHPDDETIDLGAQLCRFEDALLVRVTDGATDMTLGITASQWPPISAAYERLATIRASRSVSQADRAELPASARNASR